MTAWSAAEIAAIHGAEELEIASHRPDGSLRPAVTIWVVTVGTDVVVRSARGPENGWFRRATAAGTGVVAAGGVRREVAFDLVDDGGADAAWHAAVDAAYHVKYDRYGAGIVGSVVGPIAATATLRLVARD